jgi:hypothetical protein
LPYVTALHVFFHIYADGDWAQPVTEWCEALVCHGLAYAVDTAHVGYVGNPANIAAAQCTVNHYLPGHDVIAESPTGWEQETLGPLHQFVQDHDGYVSYAHTKGASRSNPIDTPWRRSMIYHNIVNWRTAVEALERGCAIAGCHWIESHVAGPNAVAGFGNGGMFAGNFWWTRCELLRRNVRPARNSRFEAEHWLGQLSEVMPITPETICDLNPGPIGSGAPDW